MASAHPPNEMVIGYATGAAPEGVALLVASHLTYCARCRAEVAAMEAMAGALFAGAEGAAMAPGALDAVMAKLDGAGAGGPIGPAVEAAPPGDGVVLPAPVAAALAAQAPGARWRFRMPGVSEIALPAASGERVSLLRVRPGAGVPAHTHTAVEATLVIQGSLIDRGRRYGPGDVAIADEADDHHPSAGPECDCICLAVLAGGMRFTGAFGRALNLFAE